MQWRGLWRVATAVVQMLARMLVVKNRERSDFILLYGSALATNTAPENPFCGLVCLRRRLGHAAGSYKLMGNNSRRPVRGQRVHDDHAQMWNKGHDNTQRCGILHEATQYPSLLLLLHSPLQRTRLVVGGDGGDGVIVGRGGEGGSQCSRKIYAFSANNLALRQG